MVIQFAALVGLNFLFGLLVYYFAEGSRAMLDSTALYFALLSCSANLFILFYFINHRLWLLFFCSLSLSCLPIAAFVAAQNVKQNAYNDCVKNSEHIRRQILKFKNRTGTFPENKIHLAAEINLCGRLYLRVSILRYVNMAADFKLSFGDNFTQFEGGSRQEMTSFK
jgi:hypothetical protein